jgi:hypothetical protein
VVGWDDGGFAGDALVHCAARGKTVMVYLLCKGGEGVNVGEEECEVICHGKGAARALGVDVNHVNKGVYNEEKEDGAEGAALLSAPEDREGVLYEGE